MPPELLNKMENGMYSIKLNDTLGYTIAALRGLRAETRSTEAELRQQISDLEARLQRLEQAAAVTASSR